MPFAVEDLPTVNAILNLTAAIFLTLGYWQIRRGRRVAHTRLMICALICSALFLTSYLTYHYFVGSVPYPYHDWTRPLYFSILIPHVILAAVMSPFVILITWRAYRGDFERHKRLARLVWPVWMFVSITGVLVYLMLHR